MRGTGTGLDPRRRRLARHGRTTYATHARARAEHGMSLIEVILSVVILSTAVITIVASFGATITNSDNSTRRSALEIEARRIAEFLRSEAQPMANCSRNTLNPASPPAVGAAWAPWTQYWVDALVVAQIPAGSSLAISVDSAAEGSTTFTPFPACAGGPTSQPPSVQRITLTLSDGGQPPVSVTVSIVKRKSGSL